MAAYLSKAAHKLSAGSLFMTLACMTTPHAFAQGLPDPTRPPAAFAGSQEPGDTSAAAGPVLQSVLVSPNRMVAIISGKTVKLGEKYGEARVVRITENEVVLRNGPEVQVLKLFPNVEKRLASSRAGTKAHDR